MNKQASVTKQNQSSDSTTKRLAPLGWLIRLSAVAAIVLGAYFLLYANPFNSAAELDAEEIESIETLEPLVTTEDSEPLETLETAEPNISNPPPENIPITSITACIDQQIIADAEHPLLPLIEMARHGAEVVDTNVKDYTAVVTKRVRYKGKLQPEFKIFCKIRHAQQHESTEESIPFSVYTKFLNRKKGQEAIWVENRNDNKLVAHGPSGLLNLMTLHLEPTSNMAMTGNRYPIMTIGMLNLIKQMIGKGSNDINYGDCKVILTRNVQIREARCTRIEIVHENKADHFEFHRAQIYIDDDRNLPIAFRSYLWPDKPGGKPKLLESYSYSEIQLNVGLTDEDFDPANEEYDYPGF